MTRAAESLLSNRGNSLLGGTVNVRGKKILLAALVLGSLFGANTVMAMANQSDGWDMSIVVEDNSTPACNPVITPATWSPVDPIFTTNFDLMAPPPNLNFSVSLMFEDGSNSCDPATPVEPTGIVTTTFTPADSPGNLEIGMMDCEDGCQAGTLSNDGYDGRLSVSPTMPTTSGTFGGRLEVVWAP
jgi:hypothetical protein